MKFCYRHPANPAAKGAGKGLNVTNKEEKFKASQMSSGKFSWQWSVAESHISVFILPPWGPGPVAENCILEKTGIYALTVAGSQAYALGVGAQVPKVDPEMENSISAPTVAL